MYNAKYTQAKRAGNQMPDKLAVNLDQFGLDWCFLCYFLCKQQKYGNINPNK